MAGLEWDRARQRDATRPGPPQRDPAAYLRKPTPKQLRYLRVLALQTETTFQVPETAPEASREIARMQHLPKKHRK